MTTPISAAEIEGMLRNLDKAAFNRLIGEVKRLTKEVETVTGEREKASGSCAVAMLDLKAAETELASLKRQLAERDAEIERLKKKAEEDAELNDRWQA